MASHGLAGVKSRIASAITVFVRGKMRVVQEYSHLDGAEILKVQHPSIDRELYQMIELVQLECYDAPGDTGAQLSAEHLDRQFRDLLLGGAYAGLREECVGPVTGDWSPPDGEYRTVEFAKQRVLTAVRFDSYPAVFYDAVKFQHFYSVGRADVGVQILPCHALQQRLSLFLACGEQLIYDIENLKPHFPAVPVKVILIDTDKDTV